MTHSGDSKVESIAENYLNVKPIVDYYVLVHYLHPT